MQDARLATEGSSGSWLLTAVLGLLVPSVAFLLGRYSVGASLGIEHLNFLESTVTVIIKRLRAEIFSVVQSSSDQRKGSDADGKTVEVPGAEKSYTFSPSTSSVSNDSKSGNVSGKIFEQRLENTELGLPESGKNCPLKAKELRGDAAEDLDFFRTLIGNRTSFLSLIKFLDKKMSRETQFIAEVNQIRRKFVVESLGVLRRFFQKSEPLSSEIEGAPALHSLAKEYGGDDALVQSVMAFMKPRTAFDAVEQNLLLKVGHVLFPKYRSRIKGFLSSVDAAFKKVSLKQLHRQFYEKLWETDPEIIATMHHHPPFMDRAHQRGKLRYSTARSFSRAIVEAEFRIQMHNPSPKTQEEKKKGALQKLGRFVLYCEGDLDPVFLDNSEIERDENSGSAFVVSGQSATHPKKRLTYTLESPSPEEREKWIRNLSLFQSSPKNASGNIAMIVNFIKKYADALRERDMEALGNLSETICRHMTFGGLTSPRVTVAMSLRAVLCEAAGKESWDDTSFRECMGWLMLLMEVRLSELEECNLARRDFFAARQNQSLNSSERASSHSRNAGGCTLS
eukprot:CAMPEP_0184495990 /NCGR_PEP_ID=MMETSP0113_2-20130426/32862_1 /TAXON_ID=91329 /ORGANISM="Norrisiella sphaerica, Strain BC52" /LENGTH=564 /DNA_ID=CAMNT_0026882439 /DNA_START=11 /DNA_END=1702 /DNA_ORIENTATION=-